jgi:hypothetical protein
MTCKNCESVEAKIARIEALTGYFNYTKSQERSIDREQLRADIAADLAEDRRLHRRRKPRPVKGPNGVPGG